MGTTKGGAFDIAEGLALELLSAPNPHGKPNSDVVVPWVNGMDLTQRPKGKWIIDYGVGSSEPNSTHYESPFEYLRRAVKPEREKNNRESYRRLWWQHVEARPAMRAALAPLRRFLCTTRVSKHRLFVWLKAPTLPDSATFAFARADDFFFGVLHSRLHEIWSLKQGSRLEDRPRYTPNTCFETFPFPFPNDLSVPPPAPAKSKPENASGWEGMIKSRFLTVREEPPSPHVRHAGHKLTAAEHRSAIAAAAKELNELRERWLIPPEWTVEKILEFPGSVDGPWARYVVTPKESGVGTVRYPRLEPRDSGCAAKLKKRTLTNLYNERPAWLDVAHQKLDAAVAAAYGWPADLSDEQILEKLLALNLERAAEEEKSAKVKEPKLSRAKQEDELI
jgi:hypothetical protein